MSKFLILLYDNEQAWVDNPQASERLMAGHQAFGERNGAHILGSNALQPVATATVVRSDGAGGFTVSDGPFAETKEALGGYYLVEAADLDQALAIAKLVPVLKGGVEVRPVMVF